MIPQKHFSGFNKLTSNLYKLEQICNLYHTKTHHYKKRDRNNGKYVSFLNPSEQQERAFNVVMKWYVKNYK